MDIKINLTNRLFAAYYNARRHKRNTISALFFEIDLEKNILQLRDEILSGDYKPLPPSCFIINKPVKREIFAADFRDRVVHHLIFDYISPIFEKLFIADCYSCRIGKGTSYGVNRVEKFLRQATANNKKAYVLKLDISGYFMSINQEILYNKIKDKIFKHDKQLDELLPVVLQLIRLIIFQEQTIGCKIKGNQNDWVGLPRDKSLFFSQKGNGLPIGNLTSQLFANIYLNDFDHFMKRVLKIKYYGRYVDDMIFIHSDKKYLKSLIFLIRNYLLDNLGLRLHPKKIKLTLASGGLLFLGVCIKPKARFIGKRTKRNFYGLINRFNREVAKNRLNDCRISYFMASVNSYLGFLGQVQAFFLKKKLMLTVDKIFFTYYAVDKKLKKINFKKLVK